QAEDGIRCATVTGVQTCALPIFPAPGYARNLLCRAAGASGCARPRGPALLSLPVPRRCAPHTFQESRLRSRSSQTCGEKAHAPGLGSARAFSVAEDTDQDRKSVV